MAALAGALIASPAAANHGIQVEGNCFGSGSGDNATGIRQSPVQPGTCGDHDGDGRIGDMEDADGDNTFGSIQAAVGAVAHNGRISIVASGTFPEALRLTPEEGASITLEAAPGVDANLEAVVQGQAGGEDRITSPGIFIKGCGDCRVIVRNLTIRNWAEGVRVGAGSVALIDDVRMDGNLNFGIRVRGHSYALITDSNIAGTGFRKGAAGAGEPDPGIGIKYTKRASGTIFDTAVSGSAGAGIDVQRREVHRDGLRLDNNNPNRVLR